MDEFLSQFREAPRPEFARTLAERLKQADRAAQRRARAVARLTRLAASAVCVLVSLGWMSYHQPQPAHLAITDTHSQPIALLLPGASTSNSLMVHHGFAAQTAVDTTLVAPAALSHHH